MSTLNISKNLKVWIRYAVFIAAYAILIYQLTLFEHWESFRALLKTIPFKQYTYLLFCIVLISANWGIEIFKWRYLTSPIKKLSLSDSTKSVLTGLVAGFLTPAKVGDWPGRSLVFDKKVRLQVTLVAQFNSLIKTIAISTLGIGAWAIYSFTFEGSLLGNSQLIIIAFAIVILLLFIFLFSRRFMDLLLSLLKKDKNNAKSAEWITISYRSKALILSLLRTTIFSLQFILLSRFFLGQAFGTELFLIAPIYFFILTFIPAFAFADPGIRGSVAILVFQSSHIQTPIVATIGISLWILNTILPFILGSLYYKLKP